MNINTERSKEELGRVRTWAEEHIIAEESRYPGMTYEEGVRDVIAWLEGDMDEAPDEEGEAK